MKKYFLSKKVIIKNELGLHARPAGMIAKIAEQAASTIWIEKNGKPADASMITDILTLFCPKGTEITIGIEDANDSRPLNRIIELIENNFIEVR